MLKRVVAYLQDLLRRLEHRAAGDVATITQPLTQITAQLDASSAKAIELADKAKVEAAALTNHATSLEQKAVEAARAATNLKALLA